MNSNFILLCELTYACFSQDLLFFFNFDISVLISPLLLINEADGPKTNERGF